MSSRLREILLFAAGLVVGAFLFYTVAWRTGALAEGHWLTKTSHDLRGISAAPLPHIPAPATPSPTRVPSPAATLAPATPGAAAVSAIAPAAAPPPAASAPFRVAANLLSRGFPLPRLGPLRLPVEGARVAALQDSFDEARGNGTRHHEAIDILAPRGTGVVAAADGAVAKLLTSPQGGLTVYELDRSGEYGYSYAHLDHYAPGLAEGALLARGDRIGDVGTTGNAPLNTPHLHFSVFRLGADKRWWKGEAVNPYPLLLRADER